MDIITIIRKIARQSYWQTLYAQAKELGCIQIFNNNKDFSWIQIMFLEFLSLYYSVLTDIALNEVSKTILEDDIYTDAWLIYKNRQNKTNKKQRETTIANRPVNSNSNPNTKTQGATTSFIFKSPKKSVT